MTEKYVPSNIDEVYDCLHMNEHYAVVISEDIGITLAGVEYIGGYEVINRGTGITEFATTCLPEAMHNAEHLNSMMTKKSWNWRNEKVDAEKSAIDEFIAENADKTVN